MGIIGALIKKNNSGIMGVKFEKGASPIKVQSLSNGHVQTSLATMEERDRMDTLDSVRDSQLSFSADTESESNSSNTCCSSSSSTKTVSLLDRLFHQHFNGSCMRKFQKEKNYYKNNRGSFWELENRIMGRKKKNNVRMPSLRPSDPFPPKTKEGRERGKGSEQWLSSSSTLRNSINPRRACAQRGLL